MAYGEYNDPSRPDFIRLVRMTAGMTLGRLSDELQGNVPYAVVDTPEEREKCLRSLTTCALMIGSYT